jgi:(p)ppGpp synthase/HD superfamily hydrolase
MTGDEQALIAAALAFALEAHGDQVRKGTAIPYVSHLVQVAGLVLEYGGDAEQVAAALLHDTIEDCAGVDAAGLRARFGGEVARIVESCSDVFEGDEPGAKSPWLERKRRYIDHLGDCDTRTRLVAACDKLHNLRSMIADLEEEGTGTLERFTATPSQMRWYYDEVRGALGADLPHRLLAELDGLIDVLRHFVPEASAQG